MREYDEMDTAEYWKNRPRYKGVSRAESLTPGKSAFLPLTPEESKKKLTEQIAMMSTEEIEKSLSN